MTTAETTVETTVEQRELASERAAGLRQLAALVEAHPELDATYLNTINVFYAYTKETMRAIARAGREFGANVTKDAAGSVFTLRLSWGRFRADTLGSREQVCTRVKIGEQTVTEDVPDPDALAAVPRVTRTRVEDKFEWRCEPLMAETVDPAVTA